MIELTTCKESMWDMRCKHGAPLRSLFLFHKPPAKYYRLIELKLTKLSPQNLYNLLTNTSNPQMTLTSWFSRAAMVLSLRRSPRATFSKESVNGSSEAGSRG